MARNNWKPLIIVGALTLGSYPLPARAEGLNLGRIIGAVASVRNGHDECRYLSGIEEGACRLRQVRQIGGNTQRASDMREASLNARESVQRYLRRNQALVAACRAGDTESCQRGADIGPRETQALEALAQACEAGDTRSCQRIAATVR